MIILLTGESGVGKSTIAQLLSKKLNWKYFEGDDFHPASNILKMKNGVPLTDSDREPWLKAIRQLIIELSDGKENAVITCSALKKCYRDFLLKGTSDVKLVYLFGDLQLIKKRIQRRKFHFFNRRLLSSQSKILEEPEHALKINVDKEPPEITAIIIKALLGKARKS